MLGMRRADDKEEEENGEGEASARTREISVREGRTEEHTSERESFGQCLRSDRRHAREGSMINHSLDNWILLYIHQCVWHTTLSKRNGAKFRELSLNFPRLAVHGLAKLPGSTGAGVVKLGGFSFARPCTYECMIYVPARNRHTETG